jgi:hypothetical protein
MNPLRPLTGLVLLASATAHAHSGHGAAQDWHWHATDTSGFLLVAVLAGLALWLSRRGE